MWGFGLSKGFSFGASRWHSEAPTLHYFFLCVFTHGLHLGLVMVVVNSSLLLLVILLMQVVMRVKGSGSPKKMRLGVSSHSNPDPTPRRWKRLRPFLRRSGEVRWVCLAIFFLALVGKVVCTGDAWNLPSEGTGIGGFRLVSPAEGTSALALVRYH